MDIASGPGRYVEHLLDCGCRFCRASAFALPLCFRGLLPILLMVSVALAALPRSALAQVYVAYNGDRIGEYTTTGTTVNTSLISSLAHPVALAISGNSLYESNSNTGTIGLYTTAGTPVNTSFITGLTNPDAIAISGSTLYVLNTTLKTIGTYNALTGATINNSFVTGLPFTSYGMAASGSHLFVASNGVAEYDATTGALVNSAFISFGGYTGITASDGYLYLVSSSGGGANNISKFTTDGTPVSFPRITDLIDPFAVAVSGSNLFVTSGGSLGIISEFNATTGAVIGDPLVTGVPQPLGIAAVPVPEPASLSLLALAAVPLLYRRRRRGTGHPRG